jgi:nicotinate-nucleotide adenylyltransferase
LKIAIFGGTFDPVHRAHIAVAIAARERFGLDRVLLIPAANPPHKNAGHTESYEHRYRMVELACGGISGLEPSRLEAGGETSYSIATIERVGSILEPHDRLFFLIGADAFAEVRSWFQWEKVVRAVEFIVVSRPGHEFESPPGAIVHRMETVSMDVSSSEIRDQIAKGERPQDLPAAVYDYIHEHRLYLRNSI